MESEDLYRYEFRRELMNMASSCVGLKPNTAKKKIDSIFQKYKSIICYSSNYNPDYYDEKYAVLSKKFSVLKRGYVNYRRGDNTSGILLLKDIEQIEVREKDILLITKTGREITMGEDFKYLEDLF